MRILPFFFGTTWIGEIQVVGPVAGSIMPCSSSASSSSLTVCRRWNEIRLRWLDGLVDVKLELILIELADFVAEKLRIFAFQVFYAQGFDNCHQSELACSLV